MKIKKQLRDNLHSYLKYLVTLSLLFSYTSLAYAEWTEWVADISLGYEHHDNLNHSAFDNDEESDSVILASGTFGRTFQMSSTARLVLTAELKGESYNDFDQLNGNAWGGTAKFTKKFGVGSDKLWLSVYTSYEDWSRREDFWATENLFIGFKLGKNFTPRWSAWFGAEVQNRDGEDGPSAGLPSSDVFSEDITQLSAASSYSLTQSMLLTLRLDVWSGEFHSACTVPNVGMVLAWEGDNVRALALDANVFGGCVYSLDGDGESVALSLNYVFDRHSSLDFSWQYDSAEGDALDYDSSVISALYSYRF